MLITFTVSCVVLSVIFGYSLIFKQFLLNKKNILINNIDFIYGIFLLTLISLTLNFFFPLKIFTIPICIIGLIFFLYGFLKKKFNFNFLFLLLFLFTIIFISYFNGNNVDSPMYHLQIIKWIKNYKATFGLSNLEIRYGMNASWHSFISLMDINYYLFSIKYYLNSIVLALIINEITVQKIVKKSNVFLFLTVSYLLFFSYIHPFKNGIILNHLGNPEIDIISNIFFILIIYIFFKLDENNYSDLNYAYLLIFFSILCITSRIIFIPAIILVIFLYLKNKKLFFNKINFFLILFSFCWLLKSFIISGCFIFPSTITCFDTSWATSVEDVRYHAQETMSYNRDNPFRLYYKDFDYTLNSNKWIIPWLKNYFLQTALLMISFSMLIISSIILLIMNFKKFSKLEPIEYLIGLVFIFIFCIWYLSPEIRYVSGLIISAGTILIVYIIFNAKLNNQIPFKYMTICVIILSGLLIYKNTKYFKVHHLFEHQTRIFNYSHIFKVGNFDGYEVFASNIWQCAEFKDICLNKPKKKYHFAKQNGYFFILRESKE